MTVTERDRTATSPLHLSGGDLVEVAKRVRARVREDEVPLVAGGVAFFAMLALIPGLIAVVTVYGIVADPGAVESMVKDTLGSLSPEARTVVTDSLRQIASGTTGWLSTGLLVSLGGVLWAASKGVSYLLAAVGVAFEVDDERSRVERRGASLAATVVAVLVLAVATFFVSALPRVLDAWLDPGAVRTLFDVAQWAGLAAMLFVAVVVLYRYGPNRPALGWSWASWGAAIAVACWSVASVLFAAYLSHFGSFASTYGVLGGFVILMLWLYLTAFVVVGGAVVDHELARQGGAAPSHDRDGGRL